MFLNGISTAQHNNINQQNYNIQRRDALADWRRDTEYNSPSQQMARLQLAGISPYAQSGQSLLASAPNTRPSSMGQGKSSDPVNLLALQQGIEQIKLLKLQQQKTESENQSVQADVQNKQLDYSANLPYLSDKKKWEVEESMGRAQNNTQQGYKTAQETANLQAAIKGIHANSRINEIEAMFRNPLCKVKLTFCKGKYINSRSKINTSLHKSKQEQLPCKAKRH